MVINFNRKKLEQALSDFRRATGINIGVVDENFVSMGIVSHTHNKYCSYIQSTDRGEYFCQCSDIDLFKKCKESKTAQKRICHAGLVDVGVPILYEESIVGYLILGQMKKELDFSHIADKIKALDLNLGHMERYYNELALFDENKIESIINIAVMLTGYILFENIIYPITSNIIEKAKIFIDNNLSRHIEIEEIARSIGCSTSALYKNFHKYYKGTVGEYITRKRMDKAMQLLIETDLSIEEISQKTGFSSLQYFSKVFKKITGFSPLKFKKLHSL